MSLTISALAYPTALLTEWLAPHRVARFIPKYFNNLTSKIYENLKTLSHHFCGSLGSRLAGNGSNPVQPGMDYEPAHCGPDGGSKITSERQWFSYRRLRANVRECRALIQRTVALFHQQFHVRHFQLHRPCAAALRLESYPRTTRRRWSDVFNERF